MLTILVLTLFAEASLMPLGPKKESNVIDYTLLTACEKNIQKNCIETYGTKEYLFGNKDDSCNISMVVDCCKVETGKKECRVEDSGTVYYIEAFLKNVDTSKCMDEFGVLDVQELFKAPSPKNVHEFSNTHRTIPALEIESPQTNQTLSSQNQIHNYNPDDEDGHSGGESGSGDGDAKHTGD